MRSSRRWAARPASTWRSSWPRPAASTGTGYGCSVRRSPRSGWRRTVTPSSGCWRVSASRCRGRSAAPRAGGAEGLAARIGSPLILRPAYTLGGPGGGIAHDAGELARVVQGGIAASPIGQVLVERSLIGWKELEYAVMGGGAESWHA